MDETIALPPKSNPDGDSVPNCDAAGHDTQKSEAADYGNLIHQLIESQQQLTAVERFAQRHTHLLSPALESQ